jgi:FkbM family methyltransferase
MCPPRDSHNVSMNKPMNCLARWKSCVRDAAVRLGYGVFDLRKDTNPAVFLPGHLQATFVRLGINCVVDVGANVGQFASMIRGSGYTGRIVSIEPVADTYAALSRLAQADPSWRTLNVALGRSDGEKTFNVFADRDMSSFLNPVAGLWQGTGTSCVANIQTVTVKRLDAIFDKVIEGLARPRVFLKLDTQGYDLEVAAGANDSLRYVLGVQTELSVVPVYQGMPDYVDALRIFRNLGFELTGVFPVCHDQQTGHVIEFDAVMTRRSIPEA